MNKKMYIMDILCDLFVIISQLSHIYRKNIYYIIFNREKVSTKVVISLCFWTMLLTQKLKIKL